jgi:hypothetical protein
MNQHGDKTESAIDILLQVARTIAPEVPEDLLRRIYGIEVARQYDEDPDLSRQEVFKVLEAYVTSTAASGSDA